MTYQTFLLNNGLRIIHQSSESNISYCGFAINVGTRHELPGEEGMAHFVEHMLFKGTQKRKAHHIVNRMENVGGELNAYTTKEETFVYAAFLEEYLQRAMDLLGDMVFNSYFPQKQIERERDVIIDEIQSYKDSPSELIFDDFERLLFSHQSIGNYILGTKQSLNSFDHDSVKSFVLRNYLSERMVFFSFGKTPFKKVVRWAQKYFSYSLSPDMLSSKNIVSSIPAEHKGFNHLNDLSSDSLANSIPTEHNDSDSSNVKPNNSAVSYNPQKMVLDKDTVQTHIIMGRPVFEMFNNDRYTLLLINNLLSGGDSSRLNVALREKRGLVYSVESNVALYTDTGVFSIYFGCDPKNADKCIRLVEQELSRLQKESLTPIQLQIAKKQLCGQIGIASENHENVALGMAKRYLHFNNYESINETFRRIKSITSDNIKRLSVQLLNPEWFSYLKYK